MKRKAVTFMLALFSLLASCEVPTSTIPGLETIWWQLDEADSVRFFTNDDRHCAHSFVAWDDSFVDPFQRLDVEVRKVSGNPWGSFGVVFCVQDVDNYYLLGIDTFGYYMVWKVVRGNWDSIVDWTYSHLLNKGYDAENRLQVSYNSVSSTFTVKFNGSVVTSFVDRSLNGGYGGYFAEVAPQEFEHFPYFPVDVRFKDLVAIAVMPAGGLVTTEAGGTDGFSIVLENQPGADVVIPLSTGDATEGSVSPAAVTFTPGNWDVPQPVTVTGADDGLVDGDQTYTILTGQAVSADSSYSGLDPLDVSVVNRDNELFKVLPPYAQEDALFGGAVAIDGDYALAGATGEGGGGAAYVYHRIGANTWDSGLRIVAPDAQASDSFGSAVAISGDYAVVGAPGEDDGGSNAGAAYIFHRTGSNTWDYGTKIMAADAEANDAFGLSVSISGDYLVIGALYKNVGAARAGAAYVFHRTDLNNWDSETKITSPNPHYDEQFGCAVGISGDFLIAGARYDSEGGSGAGAAYVFRRTDTNSWGSVTKIMAPDAQYSDHFGASVGISGDYAVVGASEKDQVGRDSGAAYVFHRIDTNSWDSGTKILSADLEENDLFGCSVGVSGDRVVAGARGEDGAGSEAGAAYVFVRTDTNAWDAGTKILASDAQASDRFGCSAGISGTGAILGAERHDQGGTDAGAAYIYLVP